MNKIKRFEEIWEEQRQKPQADSYGMNRAVAEDCYNEVVSALERLEKRLEGHTHVSALPSVESTPPTPEK